jgi:hypothetical protein
VARDDPVPVDSCRLGVCALATSPAWLRRYRGWPRSPSLTECSYDKLLGVISPDRLTRWHGAQNPGWRTEEGKPRMRRGSPKVSES